MCHIGHEYIFELSKSAPTAKGNEILKLIVKDKLFDGNNKRIRGII